MADLTVDPNKPFQLVITVLASEAEQVLSKTSLLTKSSEQYKEMCTSALVVELSG